MGGRRLSRRFPFMHNIGKVRKFPWIRVRCVFDRSTVGCERVNLKYTMGVRASGENSVSTVLEWMVNFRWKLTRSFTEPLFR